LGVAGAVDADAEVVAPTVADAVGGVGNQIEAAGLLAWGQTFAAVVVSQDVGEAAGVAVGTGDRIGGKTEGNRAGCEKNSLHRQ